jgi:hypothetical protein
MLYHNHISHWQSSIIIIFISNQPKRCVVCAALVVVQRVMIESDRWIDYSLPHSASCLVVRTRRSAEE